VQNIVQAQDDCKMLFDKNNVRHVHEITLICQPLTRLLAASGAGNKCTKDGLLQPINKRTRWSPKLQQRPTSAVKSTTLRLQHAFDAADRCIGNVIATYKTQGSTNHNQKRYWCSKAEKHASQQTSR